MTNSLVTLIDMFAINEDGTIEIIDRPILLSEYPFPFQYKLYLTFEENEKEILKMLFRNKKANVAYTPRLSRYLENRKALYEEVHEKYFSIISGIQNSDFSAFTKRQLIQKIDLELNTLYPYAE